VFEPVEFARIEGEFLSLSGGDIWDRIESVAWQRLQLEREHSHVKQLERRSREHGRAYHRSYERARRVRNKQRDAIVRCCPCCRRMWALTAAQVQDGTRYCSPKCAARQRVAQGIVRPARMVTIDGVTRTLPEWAQRFGITVGMVYRRVREGMPVEQALTASKTRGRGVSQRKVACA